ncbi:MAG TPA: nucleotidyltransferase domain-containing protein [Burkholderiales bacterium]|jgi:predicted nucleotidyltransferase|nr:nucleotidyltransferase domain-containing protein [Burkholderiales bacterium]
MTDTTVLGEEILQAALELAKRNWQERLVAAYALGSLAHGGFSEVSDVDLALVLGDPLSPTDSAGVADLVAAIKSRARPFSERLSVFWGSVSTLSGASAGGRFPPLDRLDLKQYGRLLAGRDVREHVLAPSREELVVAAAEHALSRLATDDALDKIKSPELLGRSDARTVTKLILFPVRFLYTARTGEVGRNEAAVAHFASAAKDPAAAELAMRALGWRNGASRGLGAGAVPAIAAGLLPLYQEFLEDHEGRLQEYQRHDLAEGFNQWRQRLMC